MKLLQWLESLFAPQPAPTPVPPLPPQPGLDVANLIAALNIERQAVLLPPLVPSASLSGVAQMWANEMASMGQLVHGDFPTRIAAVYPNTAASEDIAEGQTSIAQVVSAWMASPPHRANILGKYTIVGAGFARDGNGNIYWCADFDDA